jgi:hypothetical protein
MSSPAGSRFQSLSRDPSLRAHGPLEHATGFFPTFTVFGMMDEIAYERLETITEDDLLKIHLSAAKGQHRGGGVRNWPRFRAVIKDLRRAAGERKPLIDIIAEVFDDIERDPQPFVECNHRTAMHLGLFLAKQFGQTLRYSDRAGEKLREEWETMTKAQLRQWISDRLVPLEGD